MNLQNIFLFFGLLIVSLYIYWKGLNISNITKRKKFAAIIFSLIMSVPLSYVPFLYEVIFLVSVTIFVATLARIKFSLMFTSVLISVGISLGIGTLAELILVSLGSLIHAIAPEILIFQSETMMEMVYGAMGLLLSVVFAYLLFRIKRLKKGFAFLDGSEARWTGIAFALLIAVSRSARHLMDGYVVDDGLYRLVIFLAVVIGISTIGIYFWWGHSTSSLYQQRLKQRAIQGHQAILAEKARQIERLMESNQFLSETVHRDNKLIPAMYKAVHDYLANAGAGTKTEVEAMAQHLLGELDEMMQERQAMIKSRQKDRKALPSTEMARIDHILSYMYQRCLEENIQFDLVLSGQEKERAESVIEKQSLEVLLADLIENAMIAVSYHQEKRILVTMGMAVDCFEISIQDSGIPFEPETLRVLGLKKATTHSGRGGKGIGYMAIFKILSQSGASLVIAEHAPEEDSFTKSIKVRFDGKSEFVIHTYRAEEIQPPVNRQGMLVLKTL